MIGCGTNSGDAAELLGRRWVGYPMKVLLALLSSMVGVSSGFGETGYDPMAFSKSEEVELRDVSFVDADRAREILLRIYFAKGTKKAPVVLFSHGLGGSRENNRYIGNHWALRGYVVVAIQHAGSDESVWKGVPLPERSAALRKAASAANSLARNEDVGVTLDQLDLWNGEEGHFLFGRADMEKVGMSGHSFGAVTTQAVSGQTYGRGGARFTDSRIDAAIAFSPNPPAIGDPGKAFGSVKIPWLLMTGTEDKSVIARTTPEKRRQVYANLPPGGKYELVLEGAEHMAFSDRTLRGGQQRNPNHHRSIIALSTAFWDSYLKGDRAAETWLDGKGAREFLQEEDEWLIK